MDAALSQNTLKYKSAVVLTAFFLASTSSTFSQSQQAGEPLSGNEIRLWLTDSTAISKDPDAPWAQYFAADGDTPYWVPGNAVSRGQWSVRGDQYCSRWPPNMDWDCYGMRGQLTTGERRVVWISASGHETPAILIKGKHPPKQWRITR